MQKARQATCDICSKTVGSREKALSCGGCVQRRHTRCFTPAISDDVFNLLQSNPSFAFKCGKCLATPNDPGYAALAQAISGINATLNLLTERLTALEDKIETPAPPPTAPDNLKEMIHEAIQQQENRSQMVVTGMPEGADEASYMRNVFKRIGAEDCDITEIYRMGELRDDDDEEDCTSSDHPPRPRFVKVKFTRSAKRDRVLVCAKKLKDDTQYPVFLRPSYTLRERRRISDLYKQKRHIEESDDKSFFIRRYGPVSEWSIEPAIIRPFAASCRPPARTTPARLLPVRPPSFTPTFIPTARLTNRKSRQIQHLNTICLMLVLCVTKSIH